MKEVIATTAAPGAIGPYSQAIKAGNLLFCSGQIPVDPATGTVPEGIKAQTAQSLANVKAILAAAGASIDNVVKDNRIPCRHEPFRRNERGLRPEFQRAFPCPLGCSRARTSQAGSR